MSKGDSLDVSGIVRDTGIVALDAETLERTFAALAARR
jgi:hypothetical protein